MTDAQKMMSLFKGSDLAHGRSELTKEVTPKGKRETKSWLEKKPVTEEDWQRHLDGLAGIGIPPLTSDNTVHWGAIDVDVYEGLSIEGLNQKIIDHKLPLILCRSKSGGPHLFLFMQEPVPASMMIEKLDSLAGFLGFGTSEIFPKQVAISREGATPDYGSWINMPYFGGTKFLRYALNESGAAIQTVSEFVSYCAARALTKPQLVSLETPSPTTGGNILFPDGPPCLNTIMAGSPSDLRNIILANAAVYCRKAYGDGWAVELDKVNQRFSPPLGSTEVEALKKSYGKKEYRYQCSKQPLCNFCESSKCKKMRFGIGQQDFLPAQRSLTMIDTVPPVWYLDITSTDGKDTRISLSTEQLQNPMLFQRRVMEAMRKMPPVMKQEEWEEIVRGLMVHCRKVDIAPEMTPAGQFQEMVYEFVSSRASKDSIEDVIRGIAYKDENSYYFRLKDLWSFLATKRFTLLPQHQMIAILNSDQMKGSKKFVKIAGVGCNLMVIPLQPEYEPEALTIQKTEQAF